LIQSVRFKLVIMQNLSFLDQFFLLFLLTTTWIIELICKLPIIATFLECFTVLGLITRNQKGLLFRLPNWWHFNWINFLVFLLFHCRIKDILKLVVVFSWFLRLFLGYINNWLALRRNQFRVVKFFGAVSYTLLLKQRIYFRLTKNGRILFNIIYFK